ncbi:phosphoribosylanthranilate isomerase [Membranihabitans marinus]|uniref:phosphoribosylanthranilate isomerase n=1 Tax=Membranihabitans marinus TaxID=1227546 RepID=UPI001F477D71|nr:phosphoribosylanthranilate isomerase [Membranihabitans marinus]
MKIKVCGMRDPDNVRALEQLPVDYIGFIFYPKSKRDVSEKSLPNTKGLHRVGVFVNEDNSEILKWVEKWDLTHVQLHGDESPSQCLELRRCNVVIMKAVSVDDNFDFDSLLEYESSVDYFVFDTKGEERGGNGIAFNWQKLEEYKGNIPFFLSGGIHRDSAAAIKAVNHPQLFAVDINSRFEKSPGLKNIESIKSFIYELQN